MKKIDLKDYRQTGEGANGRSYDSLSDPLEMVKLYNTDYPTQPIFEEFEIARKAFLLGVPSPDPGELVTDGERIGIKFRKIQGKRSFSRMLADAPEQAEALAVQFARASKALHSIHCPEGMFPSAKDQYFKLLDADKAFNEREKDKIREFILGVPDTDTALHGDLHIGNMVLSSEKELYFIDMGYFSCGCPLFDLGMTRNICLTADEEFRRHDFHVTGELTREFWKYFIREYFFGEEQLAERWFGPGQTEESVSEALRPYESCKMLLVEYNLGTMLPNYEKAIRQTFNLQK